MNISSSRAIEGNWLRQNWFQSHESNGESFRRSSFSVRGQNKVYCVVHESRAREEVRARAPSSSPAVMQGV